MAVTPDPEDWTGGPAPGAASVPTPLPEQQRHSKAQAFTPDPQDWTGGPSQPPPSIMDGSDARDAFLRGTGLGTRDVVEGGTSPFTGVLDLLTWPGRAAIRAFGGTAIAPSDMVTKALDASGLPTPETPTEKAISTGVRGGTAALTTGGVGTIPSVARVAPGLAFNPTVQNAIRTLVQGSTGAIVGKEASESSLVPDWAKPTVNILGSMAGAKGADVVGNLGTKAASMITGNMNPVYDALERLNITPELAGTVSGNEPLQGLEAAGTRMPFASSAFRPAQERTIAGFGNAAENTAERLDPAHLATTETRTGAVVQGEARDWRNFTFPAAEAAVWNPVNQAMAWRRVDPTNYQQTLDDITNTMTRSASEFTPGQMTALQTLIAQDIPPGSGRAFAWQQAQDLRSRIGRAMGVPQIVQTVGQDNLNALYRGISEDMRTAAHTVGVGDAFDRANGVSVAGHNFVENTLDKVISTRNPAQETIPPEQATSNLLEGGDTPLEQTRRFLPGAADALAAYKIRDMQTAKPSVATNYNDTSTGSFLTNLNRLRQDQPGGYDALFADPTVRQRMQDLATAAGALRQTERNLNTSGTAQQLAWMQYINDAIKAPGFVGTGKAIMLPPTISLGAGKVLTNPGVTRYMSAVGAPPSPYPARVSGLLGAAPSLTASSGFEVRSDDPSRVRPLRPDEMQP